MTHDEKIVEAVATGLPEMPRPSVCYADHSYPAFSAKQMQEYARAAITAYQAEAWQDISTAPKDGTRILVWFSYSAEEQAKARVPGREEAARWSVHCGAWMLDHDACDEGHAPTLWQPLPPAPKATP